MRLAGIVPVCLGLFAGCLGSQLPEFSQQYRQRLGGALGELDRVLAESTATPPSAASPATRRSTNIRRPLAPFSKAVANR